MPDAHPTQTPPKAQKATAGKAFAAPQTPPLVNRGTFEPPQPPDPAAQVRRSYRYHLLHRLKKMMALYGAEGAVRACSWSPIPAVRAHRRTDIGRGYTRTPIGITVPDAAYDGGVVYDLRPTGMPGTVQVHRTDGRGRYYGLAHCGSPFTCPVCGPAIAARRGEEVKTIAMYMLDAGYQYLFLTLTASHGKNTALKDFKTAFNNAKHDMRRQRQYKNFCKKEGLQHHITAIEVTDDHPDSKAKSGWHYHHHIVLFFKRHAKFIQRECDLIQKKLTALWQKSLQKYGLHCDDTHGAHIAPLEKRVKKYKHHDAQKIAEYITKSIGYEMTAGALKTKRIGDDPKKDGRISSWQLLELAVKSNYWKLQRRYIAYIEAMRGLSLVRTSRGLKELCGIKDISDKDLMKGEKGQEEVYIFEDAREWQAIARQAGQGKILDIADNNGTAQDIYHAATVAQKGYDIATGEIYADTPDFSPGVARPLASPGRDARPVPPHRARAG